MFLSEVTLELGGEQPSELSFYENGELEEVRWLRDSVLHRENDLPAKITYYKSGGVASLDWLEKGDFLRDNDLPSSMWFYPNGKIQRKEWVFKTGCHRVPGPALITYDENGNTLEYYYCLDDYELDKTEWLEDPRVKRVLKNQSNGNLVSDVSL